MDGNRPVPLSDAALDRELDAALNVDPSPEFLARVRLRVASEPAPSTRGLWVFVPRAAALAAIVIVAFAVYRPADDVAGPPEVSVPVAPAAPAVEPVIAPPSAGVPLNGGRDEARLGEVRRGGRPDNARPASVARRPAGRPLPEVLIPAEDRRAFEVLVAAVQQGRLPGMPVQDPASVMASLAIPDVAIAPLVIEPLPQIAQLEGERP